MRCCNYCQLSILILQSAFRIAANHPNPERRVRLFFGDTDFYPFRNIMEREKAIHSKFLNNDTLIQY